MDDLLSTEASRITVVLRVRNPGQPEQIIEIDPAEIEIDEAALQHAVKESRDG